jgi:uncharacterized protein YbaP (TraB family)
MSARRRRPALLAHAALFLLLVSCAAAPKPVDHKHFLWSVSNGGGTVYLLGSIHVAKRKLYPLDPVIEEAFDRSDTLEVEVDTTDLEPARRDQLLQTYGYYAGDDTFKSRVSPETYALVDARFSELDTDIGRFEKMKPWLVAVILQIMELQRMGFEPQYGIDRHFINKAKYGKTIGELETSESQMQLFSSLSDGDQELYLRSTVADLDLVAGKMDQLMAAWKRGDVEMFQTVTAEGRSRHPEFEPIYRRVIDERNYMMAERVEQLLNTPGTYFVVVGSGHLVGEGSVVDRLQRKGYQIKQL